MRSLLLRAADSRWLATHLPAYPFARKAVRRFLPGEQASDALRECERLRDQRITTVITRLGENVNSLGEASAVARHYLEVSSDIQRRVLPTHLSIKLTQLGLDVDPAHATQSVVSLMKQSGRSPVWIDMESSRYTDATLKVFNGARAAGQNVGVCVQAYLRRTATDIDRLLGSTTALRLVKGAYREPAAIAFARKHDVDQSYLKCAGELLAAAREREVGHAPAFATHDMTIVRQVATLAAEMRVPRERFEFQMLYGIQSAQQVRLAQEGFRMRVLISYGEAWFAWYMRRLAERPANVWFLLRSLWA